MSSDHSTPSRLALIVEDNPDANDLLAQIARELGFDPIQTYTGVEGLEAARARHAELDILFLDLMLPDTNGYQICQSLKLERETNPIPIVMVTALGSEENRQQGFRVGADAYVTKPYTVEDIEQAVAAVMSQREQRASESVALSVRFDFSSEVANLKSVNELVGLLLGHSPLSEHDVGQIRTAMIEMGQNAIEWGNRNDAEKLVRITAEVLEDRVKIQIEDQGEGFDPRNIPHAAHDDDDDPTGHFEIREQLGLREGGFGILITNGLVDRVEYNDVGNIVTLTKHYESASSGQA